MKFPSHALIVGGASGLGAALAQLLSEHATKVGVVDVDGHAASKLAERMGPHSYSRPMDVRFLDEVRSVFHGIVADMGAVDLVVNCAGALCGGEAAKITDSQWESTLQVNLHGAINVSLVALEIMRPFGAGTIVNTSSMSALFIPPRYAPYVTSKAGVLALSRALDIEFRREGIRVLVACPGNIKTPSMRQDHKSFLTPYMDARVAAASMMRGVLRKKGLIVFPLYAKVFWYLDRLSPSLLAPFRAAILRRTIRRAEAKID